MANALGRGRPRPAPLPGTWDLWVPWPACTSALTKAIQDVVKIVEIVVALLHDGPVAHSVVQPAVGVCHCACTGQGDRRVGGRSQDNWSPRQRTENLNKPRSDQGASGLDQPGFLPSTHPPPSPLLSCLSSCLKGSPHGAGGNPQTRPPHPPPLGISLLPAETSLSAAGGGERQCVL